MILYLCLIFLFPIFSCAVLIQNIRWCNINDAEQAKCEALQSALKILDNSILNNFYLTCFRGLNTFQCLNMTDNDVTDIINIDAGLAYYAIQNYGVKVFALESYNLQTEHEMMSLSYLTAAIIVKDTVSHPSLLAGTSLCSAGAGTAEGWLLPLSKMIENKWISVTKCNSEVQTQSSFFSNGSCVPGSQDPIFNVLGDNGDASCSRCGAQSDSKRYCTSADHFTGSGGAIRCLIKAKKNNGKAVAFVRGDVIQEMVTNNEINSKSYELLCPNAQANGLFVAPLTEISSCNWGTAPSRMLITNLESNRVPAMQNFLDGLVSAYGPNGTNTNEFQIFDSRAEYNLSFSLLQTLGISGYERPPQSPYDLMFSDATKRFYYPPASQILSYISFLTTKYRGFMESISTVQNCPVPGLKWCVISKDELEKCANMKLALEARNIRPTFYCVNGGATTTCMKLIRDGFADLMTLDAAEVYISGKHLNLVPIAVEFYGDDTSYYAVAIAKRWNKDILISNWKFKRSCHGQAGRAASWVKPVTIALQTVQMRTYENRLTHSFGELVSRACVPGILNEDYNPTGKNPLNLCDICASGGQDRCQPDSREQYYGDSGAFRCLNENGDIAFVKHMTVHENTDGRNPVDWARSRRSDDYELVCPDGTRVDPYSWEQCNLGKIPGNMVVTAGYTTKVQREQMWRMLRYAQEYFASDGNPVFPMFASPYGRNDLIFSDSAVSLKPIPFENQTYIKMLDRQFVREMENMELIGELKWSGLYDPTALSGTLRCNFLFILFGMSIGIFIKM